MIPNDSQGLRGFLAAQEILIASPLKFGHICESFPSIDCLEALVIDEADKMFEMGFLE
jgi:superfamily II DNA/RNA helicase